MREQAERVTDRIEYFLDHGHEYVSEVIIELLEDAQIEIGDLLAQIHKLSLLAPKETT